MQPKDPDISVIVCTKDRPEDLARLIFSLDKQDMFPTELIISDASQTQETKNLIQAKEKSGPYPIRYFESPPGLTLQRNRSILEAKGRYVIFFDDDVVPEPGFIRAILEAFTALSGRNVAGVTGRITNTSPRATGLSGFFKKVFFLTDTGSGRMKLSGFAELCIKEDPAYVEVLSGCNMAFNKDILKEFLFDEILKKYSYLEDLEISQRMGKHHRFFYQPKARLKHLSTTHLTPDTRALRRMLIRNHVYLFKKNGKKDFLHYYGFFMSVLGLVLVNLLLERDLKAVAGILEGLCNPLMPEATCPGGKKR